MGVMGQGHIVNSEHTKAAFFANVDKLFSEHKYITFTWRFGQDRSLDQNALFHVWLTEYIAFKLKIDKRKVTKAHLAGIKRTVKRNFYLQNPFPWMVHEIKDYSTGESKKDFTSSKDWKKGEMYLVLTWFQMKAAEEGFILEAKGEFAKLKRESEQ